MGFSILNQTEACPQNYKKKKNYKILAVQEFVFR